MIGPKTDRPTDADERRAYAIAAERDGGVCQMCLRNCGAPQMDHRQNRQSGNTVASNLQTLGMLCHLRKTDNPEWAIGEGWAVSRYADPAWWPARRYFRTDRGTVRLGWCLYDDEGGVQEIGADVALARMGVA